MRQNSIFRDWLNIARRSIVKSLESNWNFFFFWKLHEKGYDKGDSIQFPSESSKKGNLSAKGSNWRECSSIAMHFQILVLLSVSFSTSTANPVDTLDGKKKTDFLGCENGLNRLYSCNNTPLPFEFVKR